MPRNIVKQSEIDKINKIRQGKILKELVSEDVSAFFDDSLENDMVLNMGPQHPATHGVLRALLRLDGENIIKCIPELGYLHRGYEKLAENMTYHEFIPFTDRMDYIAPMSNNTAVALAIENAFGIEAPERAQWIRMIASELARISSHLMAIGSTLMDVGAVTVMLWVFIEREKLYDIFELLCGARFTTSFTRIGGIAFDMDEKAVAAIKAWMDDFPKEFERMEKIAHRNRIFIDRVAGIGHITAEKAIALGLTGPVLRGCGFPRDLRKDEPYLMYDKVDFDVITFPDGDVWSRYMVRVEEIRQSLRIVQQALEKIPTGPVRLGNPQSTLPWKKVVYTKMEELIDDFMLVNFGGKPLPGETYTAIESPKGELGFFIVADDTGQPWKMKIRSPSSANLQGLPTMAEGSMISDIVGIIGSIDPIMGEADK